MDTDSSSLAVHFTSCPKLSSTHTHEPGMAARDCRKKCTDKVGGRGGARM